MQVQIKGSGFEQSESHPSINTSEPALLTIAATPAYPLFVESGDLDPVWRPWLSVAIAGPQCSPAVRRQFPC